MKKINLFNSCFPPRYVSEPMGMRSSLETLAFVEVEVTSRDGERTLGIFPMPPRPLPFLFSGPV